MGLYVSNLVHRVLNGAELELVYKVRPGYMGLDKLGTGPRLSPDRHCIHAGPPGTGIM